MQDNFKHDMDLTTTQFVYLYSWYAWPNVVLCFVGGFLIDRVFGIRLGTVIYALLVVLGQIVFAMGGLVNAFWLMVVGRFIFGIGGESLAVAQNNYAVLWFKGRELNMVFGLQLSFARVGSTVNFNVMEPLYNLVSKTYQGYTCLGVVLIIASATTLLSMISALILAWLDKRRERMLGAAGLSTGPEEVVRLSDIRHFPATFWLVAMVCVAYYLAIFPFIALGKVFFMRKFGMPPDSANFINSLVFIISAVASPILGLMVDRLGRNAVWVILSVATTLGCHALLAFTFLNPYVAMIGMGISYSIAQALQNLGLAVVTLVAGVIVDKGGYLLLEVFFLGWLCVALLFSVLILMLDSNGSGLLNMTANQRETWERNKAAQAQLEREKLLACGAMADVSPQDLLHPQSDFHIRNRYLSRIGALLPAHYSPNQKGRAYRALR
ncbi:hypothetical protein B566_EDAN000840 [Ephemera danica]|nr:hypothetical protein B566_EDAN000840 [Ephemera danica]